MNTCETCRWWDRSTFPTQEWRGFCRLEPESMQTQVEHRCSHWADKEEEEGPESVEFDNGTEIRTIVLPSKKAKELCSLMGWIRGKT